jgi:tetraacyldisaccharide 4'-kinase
MDDGFQHRWLHRDLDIVVVNGAGALAAEPLLPAGMRRELLRGLKRAHLVAFTGTGEGEAAAETLRPWFDGRWVTVRRFIESVLEPRGNVRHDAAELRGRACYAFCAIGNPDRFGDDLRHAGAKVVGQRYFRDHHEVTRDEAAVILREARVAGAELLVTTEKDFVRMQAVEDTLAMVLNESTLWVPVLGIRTEPAGVLESIIAAAVGGAR